MDYLHFIYISIYIHYTIYILICTIYISICVIITISRIITWKLIKNAFFLSFFHFGQNRSSAENLLSANFKILVTIPPNISLDRNSTDTILFQNSRFFFHEILRLLTDLCCIGLCTKHFIYCYERHSL